jgi:hypothetical protein
MTHEQFQVYLERNYIRLGKYWYRRLDDRMIIINQLANGKAEVFTFPLTGRQRE